nr:MAG TPA: hypothetical protein [Caudoviricetes sp.]DAT69703.1 MAG TPA: hypothetical protein [Caudoviricetes sp.]
MRLYLYVQSTYAPFRFKGVSPTYLGPTSFANLPLRLRNSR